MIEHALNWSFLCWWIWRWPLCTHHPKLQGLRQKMRIWHRWFSVIFSAWVMQSDAAGKSLVWCPEVSCSFHPGSHMHLMSVFCFWSRSSENGDSILCFIQAESQRGNEFLQLVASFCCTSDCIWVLSCNQVHCPLTIASASATEATRVWSLGWGCPDQTLDQRLGFGVTVAPGYPFALAVKTH